jgi:hypothetical protein
VRAMTSSIQRLFNALLCLAILSGSFLFPIPKAGAQAASNEPALPLAPFVATADVAISDSAFTPPLVTIIAGDGVVRRNIGSRGHLITSQPQGLYDNLSLFLPLISKSGEVANLFIRNDQGCIDPLTNELYVFGEIINNGPVPVDILNWDVKIYDGNSEIQTDDTFMDIPNNYAVFAYSSIPFALLTTLDRPNFTDYNISLDYAPGPHSPRSDLSIVEFTTNRDAGFTEVTGIWAHTDVANPPKIVWIIATTRDAQGRLTNLQYQHYTNASIIDPRLPPGQHSFRQLYLEDNPCGGGTIAVSILGE